MLVHRELELHMALEQVEHKALVQVQQQLVEHTVLEQRQLVPRKVQVQEHKALELGSKQVLELEHNILAQACSIAS